MDFKLNADQRAMVQTVRDLTQSKFKGRAMQYMDGSFPWENMKELAKLGILGMAVPEEYGGLGLPVFDTALVLEIAKGCYTTAMAVLGEVGSQDHKIVAAFAPEKIKKRVLPQVCSGDMILAICMTEPHAGTDVANYRTNTDVKGDKLILNGSKTLISRVDEAGLFIIFTRINKIPGREGIGCVLLREGHAGLHRNRHPSHDGRRIFRFDLVRELRTAAGKPHPQGRRIPETARSLQHPALPQSLDFARPGRGRFRGSGPLLPQPYRVQPPIGEFQGMRFKLAEMYRDIEVGRAMLYRACATANPFPDPYEAAIAKMYQDDGDPRHQRSRRCSGNPFTDEYPVSRFYRGARYGTLGGGTTETLKELVGKRIMTDFPDHDGFAGMKTF